MSDATVKYTIIFNDPELDNEERDEEVDKLLPQIRELEDVVVARVKDPSPPIGNKSLGGFLVGVLTAEVNAANAKQAFEFLRDRLGGKTIELEVEGNGKKLKVSASNRADLEAAIQQAQAFIAA
ncbi:hypothetical protein SPB21_02385 [Leptothoe sp. ISB3NOV94-8A]